MKRIDDRTVELTALEQAASAAFERQLDKGLGIHDAVVATREFYPGLDEEFWDYLDS